MKNADTDVIMAALRARLHHLIDAETALVVAHAKGEAQSIYLGDSSPYTLAIRSTRACQNAMISIAG
jgi:hypothetical protein